MQESIVKLETNNFTTIQHWVNTKHQATLSQGAFYSGKSVRDFLDFKNLRILNGFFPDFPGQKSAEFSRFFPQLLSTFTFLYKY